MAADGGCLGGSDDLPGAQGLSLYRARPAWPRAFRPALDGNDLDAYADDLAELVTASTRKTRSTSHSTSGGESLATAVDMEPQGVAKAVLIGAVPRLMLKTENNPGGLPMSSFR